MPCPHFNIRIVSRAKAESVVAAAAYQSGEKLFSEYDGQWKSGDHLERIVFKDILLPPNAPRAYADRQTLWNAVDASETKDNAQTARRFIITLPKELSIENNIALIRNYCQTQFVDKGMIVDLAVHFEDSDPPNPHAHLLCTMRSMDEQGHWNDKTKTAYALDENGNRIMGKNGKWKRIRMDTVDWNDRKYCEIWRHEWEVQQNAALEQAERTERVDMRSFKRQGIEMTPQVHLGPAAFALEKQGIHTELGNHNNAVKYINSLFSAVRHKLKSMREWLKELIETVSDHEKLESPGDFPLYQVLFAYYDLREKERWDWQSGARNKAGLNDFKEKTSLFAFLQEHDIRSINDFALLLNATSKKVREMDANRKSKEQRIRDIDAILDAVKTLKELHTIRDKYDSIFFKGQKEKYGTEHADELNRIKKAKRLLYKLNVKLPINGKELRAESAKLRGEVESMLPELECVKAELDKQMKIRSRIRRVMPEVLAFKNKDGQRLYEDVSEEIQNAKELRKLLEDSAERVIRHDPAPEPQKQPPIQVPRQETQQRRKNEQQQGDR